MKIRIFGQLEILLGTDVCNCIKAQQVLQWNEAPSWRSGRDAPSGQGVLAQEGHLKPGVGWGESHTWLNEISGV